MSFLLYLRMLLISYGGIQGLFLTDPYGIQDKKQIILCSSRFYIIEAFSLMSIASWVEYLCNTVLHKGTMWQHKKCPQLSNTESVGLHVLPGSVQSLGVLLISYEIIRIKRFKMRVWGGEMSSFTLHKIRQKKSSALVSDVIISDYLYSLLVFITALWVSWTCAF